MRCPTLSELPDPPRGRTGWPWTVETARLPEEMPGGGAWSRLAIVTPSLNQGAFLEETIRSVLLQGYPELEYLILDGGSLDNSPEIIRRYQPWLSYSTSQADRGQPAAINEGWRLSDGDIVAWINSDDIYCQGAFGRAALSLAGSYQMVYSGFLQIDECSKVIRRLQSREFSLEKLLTGGNTIPQPTVFLQRSLYEAVGPLNENLGYAFDLEYWLRAGLAIPPDESVPGAIRYLADDILACFRLHPASKSSQKIEQFSRERAIIWDWFFSLPELPAEIYAAQREAYAYLHYQQALLKFRQGKVRSGWESLKKCRSAEAAYLFKMPARLLRLTFHLLKGIMPGGQKNAF